MRRFERQRRLRIDCRYWIEQESDVLDTWFSSALWPHSTLGWPDETPELEKFYPTSVLITSRDIITLWVARMVLAGLYNMGEVPFREVYITPKILDGYGETMSKSKGNGVDPLDVIEKFGADAAAVRHGVSDDRDAGRAAAGGVRVPALRGADSRRRRRTGNCRGSSARSAASRSARSGPRSRRTRRCRAGRW